MNNLSKQIIEADKLIRDLRKIHSWIDSGKIVAAWKETGRLISIYEHRKFEVIEDSVRENNDQ